MDSDLGETDELVGEQLMPRAIDVRENYSLFMNDLETQLKADKEIQVSMEQIICHCQDRGE